MLTINNVMIIFDIVVGSSDVCVAIEKHKVFSKMYCDINCFL